MEIIKIVKFDATLFQIVVMIICALLVSWALLSALLVAINDKIVYAIVIMFSLISGALGNGFQTFWISLMVLSFTFLIAKKTNKII